MAAANGSTFDLTPARRPSLDDTGGVGFQDSIKAPPDPATMPNAAQQNAGNAHSAAFGGVIAHTVISIHYASGTPGVLLVGSARAGVIAGTFTVTPNATGDVSITWAAGTFPPAIALPMVSVNALSSLHAVAMPITNGVRVQVYNDSAALTNGDFTVAIY